MCGPNEVTNIVEMVEPLLPYIDGIIWVLHDCAYHDPGARYLESVKGKGKIIHREWPLGRHWVSMNETLYTGLIEEGDLVIWTDLLELPAPSFLSRIKTEIGPMMEEADVGCIYYHAKAFLFRYHEMLEYRNSPHWTLTGVKGRGIEWANVQPNEREVRFNTRPEKRKDQPLHWVSHFLRYWLYPAGCNHAAMGLDHWLAGDRNQQFAIREQRRLEFRKLVKARGFPLTLEGVKALMSGPLDDELKGHLNSEKVLSDYYHFAVKGDTSVKDSHNPADAKPIL